MASEKPPIVMYTDGACSGNPGPGGWGAILIEEGRERELSGGENPTTNQRMELTAPLEGLRSLAGRRRVAIYSDSAYVINCFRDKWYERWRKNRARRSSSLDGEREYIPAGSDQSKAMEAVELGDRGLHRQGLERKARGEVAAGRPAREALAQLLRRRLPDAAGPGCELPPERHVPECVRQRVRGGQIGGREQPPVGLEVVEPRAPDHPARAASRPPHVGEQRGELGPARVLPTLRER